MMVRMVIIMLMIAGFIFGELQPAREAWRVDRAARQREHCHCRLSRQVWITIILIINWSWWSYWCRWWWWGLWLTRTLVLQKSWSWFRGCWRAHIDQHKIHHKLCIQGNASESGRGNWTSIGSSTTNPRVEFRIGTGRMFCFQGTCTVLKKGISDERMFK